MPFAQIYMLEGRTTEQKKAVIEKAKSRKVRVQENLVRIEDPKGLLGELRDVPVSAELPCFEITLSRLEHDLPASTKGFTEHEGLRIPYREVAISGVTVWMLTPR